MFIKIEACSIYVATVYITNFVNIHHSLLSMTQCEYLYHQIENKWAIFCKNDFTWLLRIEIYDLRVSYLTVFWTKILQITILVDIFFPTCVKLWRWKIIATQFFLAVDKKVTCFVFLAMFLTTFDWIDVCLIRSSFWIHPLGIVLTFFLSVARKPTFYFTKKFDSLIGSINCDFINSGVW